MLSIFHSRFILNNIPYVLTSHGRPQAALIPYVSFLQRPAFKEEEMLAEFGRLASRIARQNATFTEAEVEADVATAVAEVRDNAPGR